MSQNWNLVVGDERAVSRSFPRVWLMSPKRILAPASVFRFC